MQLKTLGSVAGIVKSLGNGATSLELVSSTTRNVSSDELAAILVRTALTHEQQKAILVSRGMSEAAAEVALKAYFSFLLPDSRKN